MRTSSYYRMSPYPGVSATCCPHFPVLVRAPSELLEAETLEILAWRSIHTLQKLLQASHYMTNDLGMSCDNGDMCDTYVKCDNCYTCVCHCKYNLNIMK
jgi:hypothetical protein